MNCFYLSDSISSCAIDSVCIPIKTCAPIISQLSLAKETSDLDKKRKIISQVREKVCGDRRDRLICCPEETSSSILPGEEIKIFIDIFMILILLHLFSKHWILQEQLSWYWRTSLCFRLQNYCHQRLHIWWGGSRCFLSCWNQWKTIKIKWRCCSSISIWRKTLFLHR